MMKIFLTVTQILFCLAVHGQGTTEGDTILPPVELQFSSEYSIAPDSLRDRFISMSSMDGRFNWQYEKTEYGEFYVHVFADTTYVDFSRSYENLGGINVSKWYAEKDDWIMEVRQYAVSGNTVSRYVVIRGEKSNFPDSFNLIGYGETVSGDWLFSLISAVSAIDALTAPGHQWRND